MLVRQAYAAVGALLAMGATAAAGLLLLGATGAGRLDHLAAAVVAMATGAPARIGAAPSGGLPISLHGHVDVVPLGVTVAGATVLGVLLARRGREALLVRAASAIVVFTVGVGAVAWFGRGALRLPATGTRAAAGAPGCPPGGFGSPGGHGLPGGGGLRGAVDGPGVAGPLDGGYAVAAGPAVAGAVVLAVAVAALCWLALRYPAVAAGLRVLRWPALGTAVVGLALAAALGGRAAAGGLLLALPLGLTLPTTVHTGGVLACALDGGGKLTTGSLPGLDGGGKLTAGSLPGLDGGGLRNAVSVVALLVCCTLRAMAARRAGPGHPVKRALGIAVATGLTLAVLAVVTRASVEVGVRAVIFSVPILDVRLVADPWPAVAAGLLAGSAASLLVDVFVGWRPWRGHDPAR